MTQATHEYPVKVFMNGQTVKIGIDLSCPLDGLSMIATPNIIINQNNNHFDIIMSFRSFPGDIICSPIPHHLIDEYRFYFNLGHLSPGEYTITANHVFDHESLPPQPGVEVFDFDETGFFVPHPVPVTNKATLIIMIVLLGFVAFKYFRRKRELII